MRYPTRHLRVRDLHLLASTAFVFSSITYTQHTEPQIQNVTIPTGVPLHVQRKPHRITTNNSESDNLRMMDNIVRRGSSWPALGPSRSLVLIRSTLKHSVNPPYSARGKVDS